MVPSTFGGVTFAINENTGRAKNTTPRMLNITSVNNKNTMSLIPTSRFHLMAKKNYNRDPIALMLIAIMTIVLVSLSLPYFL